MENRDLLQEIEEATAAWKGPVLSVCLNVDPSLPGNLSQGYLTRFKSQLQRLEKRVAGEGKPPKDLQASAGAMEAELSRYKPHGKALLLFRDGPSGASFQREVRVRMREAAEWASAPMVLPLAEALDEHARYGVALVDRTRARLFVVHMGEIYEHTDLLTHDVAHSRTPGRDNRFSETNFQRRADEHAGRLSKDVAAALADRDRRYGFDRLILAGGLDARSELEHVLGKHLRRKVAGSIALDMDTSAADILPVVDEINEQAERAEEAKTVDALLDSAGGKRNAVTGLSPTIDSLGEGGVARLIVSGNYEPKWDELTSPVAWLSEDAAKEEDALLEKLVETAIGRGGRIEFVWGAAAKRLEQEAAGIGAFLRF